ncbi:MAG: ribonuclease HII [Saprospiraceae bacterium]|nr:ribonuclease HII [Saprospiraceae bacterium]
MALKRYYKQAGIEAGCDEAGRGCLAGPVFAAAVILLPRFRHPLLNDSKKVGEEERYLLREVIEREAISFGVAQLEPDDIDRYNILRASIMAMHRALDKLNTVPTRLLIDGNRFYPYKDVDHHCIIKGDGIYASIAAASILAKTYRDDHMLLLDKLYPQYQLARHKGYPTEAHRQAIREYGPCDIHRKSFRLLPKVEQDSLF